MTEAAANQRGCPIFLKLRSLEVSHKGTGRSMITPSSYAQVELYKQALAKASVTSDGIELLEGQSIL
jgi:acyl transferase domain-containing protein